MLLHAYKIWMQRERLLKPFLPCIDAWWLNSSVSKTTVINAPLWESIDCWSLVLETLYACVLVWFLDIDVCSIAFTFEHSPQVHVWHIENGTLFAKNGINICKGYCVVWIDTFCLFQAPRQTEFRNPNSRSTKKLCLLERRTWDAEPQDLKTLNKSCAKDEILVDLNTLCAKPYSYIPW